MSALSYLCGTVLMGCGLILWHRGIQVSPLTCFWFGLTVICNQIHIGFLRKKAGP